MIDNKYYELFNTNSTKKRMIIEYDGQQLTDDNWKSESMEILESICSQQNLRFGCCESSIFSLRIIGTVIPMVNKKIHPYILQDNNSKFQLGVYKVFSDKPTADRRYRDIVAYDAMHDILNSEVSAWYNTILPNADSTVTLKEFRDSFFTFFGIEQEEVELVNDSMTVTKTIEPSKLSGKTVITAICEINGCFGHIGRNGKFQYIHLKEIVKGIYPSNTLYPRDDLYPKSHENTNQIKKSHYISAEYEDFETERINKLQIRKEENDIGYIYGSGNNCYIVQDNFLVHGKSLDELQVIAENMYSVINKVSYRPAHVEAKGNPCLEVGDGIRLSTKYEIVYTYILQRTLKGIQALRDTYDAEGNQYQAEKVNSVRDDIIQLKGKTNKLTRTIEETKSEIIDIEKGLSTRIQQNAEGINLEAQRALKAEENLSARIQVNVESIVSEVNRATEAEGDLLSKISLNAENITAEVKRAKSQEVELAAAISVNADSIKLKVSKGDVSSQLSVETGQVKITSDRFVLESTNCSISPSGEIKAKNVDLTGKITASSGEIGGFKIGAISLKSYLTGTLSDPYGVYLGTDGISCGKSNAAFKVDNTGVLTLNSTLGSITLGTTGVGKMYLDKDGISFGSSGTLYTTEITKDKLKVHNTYIEKDKVHCAKGSSASTYYTDINGNEIEIVSSSSVYKTKITESYLSFPSSKYFYIKAGETILIDFQNAMVKIGGNIASLGNPSGKISFFGSASPASTKQTVNKLLSGATLENVIKKINDLLTALNNYNLIASA